MCATSAARALRGTNTAASAYGFVVSELKSMPYTGAAKSALRGKEVAMESVISDLVPRFEKGSLSRHVSIHVADLQRSVDFYQKMFGFKVVSQALGWNHSPRQHQGAGLPQPWKPCRDSGSLRDRGTPVSPGNPRRAI